MEIFEKLSEEIRIYETTALDVNPSFASTMPELLELIDKYWMSKFKDGDTDNGLRRIFLNILRFRTLTAAKATDFDTKDFKVVAEDGQSFFPSWLLGKELKHWMKETEFGKLLNECVYERPRYGTIVLKKVGATLKKVNLKNLIIDPTVEKLTDTFIIEKHEYTFSELRKQNWDKTAIEEAITKTRSLNKRLVTVFERYGEIAESEVIDGGSDDKYIMSLFITSEPVASDNDEETAQGIIFHKQFWDVDIPYYESHWERVSGRWLGYGVVEDRLESQIRRNELINARARGFEFTSLHLYQTRDDNVVRNLLTEVDNGDILRINSEITPITNEERNLAVYRDEENLWDINDDRNTFTFDAVRGERAPSGTTLGAIQIQNIQAGGYFGMRREDFGLFLKKIIFDVIIPEFKKERRHKHIFNFVSDEGEMDKLDNVVLNTRVNKRIANFLIRKKKAPSSEQIEMMRVAETEYLKSTNGRFLEIPKDFYENIKYKVDIVITGESMDVQTKLSVLQFLFQIAASNPAVLINSGTRKILAQNLNAIGINPEDVLPPVEKRDLAELTAEKGGSISVPNATNLMGQTTQTI